MSHNKLITPLAACLLLALFATPVYAHEGEEHATEAEANAHLLKPGGPMPVKPLDVIKARAQQIKQDAQNAKIELKADTKAELKMTPPGEKREVMQGAWEERKDIAKDRFASTTQLARGVKAAVMMHGGVIKNRFRLAINHLNNLLDRMDTRIDKMTAAGVDTAAVVDLHADAEVAVVKAEADAKAVADLVATVNESSDRDAVKMEMQAKMKTAQESLKAAHKAVMDTVRALVQLAKENKPDVDASVETSATVETNVQ